MHGCNNKGVRLPKLRGVLAQSESVETLNGTLRIFAKGNCLLLALLLINLLGSSIAFGLMLSWGWKFAFLGAVIGGTVATLLAGVGRAYVLRDVSEQNADQRKL